MICPKRLPFSKTWEPIVSNHKEYLAHIVRTKHQWSYYRCVLADLYPADIVVIINYKMKVELELRAPKNQREWYGKRGIILMDIFLLVFFCEV